MDDDKNLKSSSSNQNSSLLSDSAESDLRKRKIEEVEEEEDFLSSNDKEEKPKNAKLKTKQASPRGFHIPKGSAIGAATETAYALSQEHDQDKAATTKKPKQGAASPKAKKTKK